GHDAGHGDRQHDAHQELAEGAAVHDRRLLDARGQREEEVAHHVQRDGHRGGDVDDEQARQRARQAQPGQDDELRHRQHDAGEQVDREDDPVGERASAVAQARGRVRPEHADGDAEQHRAQRHAQRVEHEPAEPEPAVGLVAHGRGERREVERGGQPERVARDLAVGPHREHDAVRDRAERPQQRERDDHGAPGARGTGGADAAHGPSPALRDSTTYPASRTTSTRLMSRPNAAALPMSALVTSSVYTWMAMTCVLPAPSVSRYTSSNVWNDQMNRSSRSSSATARSWGSRTNRRVCRRFAPSRAAASSISPGTDCRRAVRNRNASGADFHTSNSTTTSSATGTGMPQTSAEVVLRKPTGVSHPRYARPKALTRPYCGLSSVFQMVVAATTGSTYGTSSSARTSPRPRNGRRSASASTSPTASDPTAVRAAYSTVVHSAPQNAC